MATGNINPAPALFILAPVVGQVKVTVTGTAVQFPNNVLLNGVIITNNGTTNCFLGGSTVNNTGSGDGNGYILAPGASCSAAIDNTNLLYVNGTGTTSFISFIGS